MINLLIKRFLGKEIILYAKHRQTHPLVNNPFNRKKYWFIESNSIWKYIPFKNVDRRKHRIMYVILKFIQPKYIISINWISRRESLYKVWTSKHPDSKFIVVQHGAYVGGIVTDMAHRFTKCDIFLTWGPFFVEQFRAYNKLKMVQLVSFGNSIYNEYDRTDFVYKENQSNKILLLPTALDNVSILIFYNLINRLQELHFQVEVKEHGKQGREKDRHGKLKYPCFEGVSKIKGHLYQILQNNDYDFIIADHSSSLLDAIFFKNKVLYFDPINASRGCRTNYSIYLTNLFQKDIGSVERTTLHELIDIPDQEALFTNMVYSGDNQIDFSQI